MTSLVSFKPTANHTSLAHQFSTICARVERPLFGLTVLGAACLMWLAGRLPMADLPQHAAQVALWRDLLLDQSVFADSVRINLATPYLLGYGLLLPLSFAFSLAVSCQILLTLTFLAFVASCMALARALGSDRRLDWFFVLSFFGFCWKWGFLTFLVASPLALVLLLLALRHAQAPTVARAAGLVLMGTVLLMSHGLMFLATMFLAGLVMLEGIFRQRFAGTFARLFPYLVLGCLALGFRLLTHKLEGAISNNGFSYGTPLWERPLTWLTDVSDVDIDGHVILPLLSSAALCAPFFFGSRFNQRPALVLLLGLFALLTFMPADAFETGGLYYRFALFLPPFIAFAFRAPATSDPASARSVLTTAAVATCCWLVLTIQGSRIAAFARESQPFETILAAAGPGQRALGLIASPGSEAAANDSAYLHYALWYQAEKHGFVDFNFAYFTPQVIRFRPGRRPLEENLALQSGGKHVWSQQFIAQYQYVFVRGSSKDLADVIQMSPCPLRISASAPPWYLLEREQCPDG